MYKSLSGEAKITYQVIDSFDWEDKETGDSKGYVFPATKTLAEIRGTSMRTIQRHIKELENVGLLTRQRRSHKASFLFIEDVSEEEQNKYIEKYVNKPKKGKSVEQSNDKNVVSRKGSQTTKMTHDNRKEKEVKKENEINVNENCKISTPEKRYGMQGMGEILKRFDTVKRKQIKSPSQKNKPDWIVKRDYLAQEIADSLGDQKSLGAFRKIAELIPEIVVRNCLANVKETWTEGKIKESRGALFMHMIQQYSDAKNINLGFKTNITN